MSQSFDGRLSPAGGSRWEGNGSNPSSSEREIPALQGAQIERALNELATLAAAKDPTKIRSEEHLVGSRYQQVIDLLRTHIHEQPVRDAIAVRWSGAAPGSALQFALAAAIKNNDLWVLSPTCPIKVAIAESLPFESPTVNVAAVLALIGNGEPHFAHLVVSLSTQHPERSRWGGAMASSGDDLTVWVSALVGALHFSRTPVGSTSQHLVRAGIMRAFLELTPQTRGAGEMNALRTFGYQVGAVVGSDPIERHKFESMVATWESWGPGVAYEQSRGASMARALWRGIVKLPRDKEDLENYLSVVAVAVSRWNPDIAERALTLRTAKGSRPAHDAFTFLSTQREIGPGSRDSARPYHTRR